jgi:hypothetical protein
MMTKNLSGQEPRLPSWFKRSKYKDIGELDLLSWYKQLWVRQYCSGVTGIYRDFWHALNPDIPKRVPQIINALRLNPLGAEKIVNDTMKSRLEGFLPENLRATSSGVHSLTMSEFFEQVATLTDEKRSLLFSYVNLPGEGQLALYTKNNDWMVQTVDIHQREGFWNGHLLSINLDLSQDFLLSSFREWLSAKRNEREKLGDLVPYAYNIREWINMGLLPCMDLLMWADEAGTSLSNRFITRAIHDDGLARESATARTTIPCARDFLNSGNKSLMQLVRLRADAAAEILNLRRPDVMRKKPRKPRN